MNVTTMTRTKRAANNAGQKHTLLAQTNRIAEACAGVWPENCILAGLTKDGMFLMQETADYSAHFEAGHHLAEQCTFRAGSTAQQIRARIEFWDGMY
jgi:hypothetical protein